MADLTPLADIVSFGGTTIGSSQHVASKGYPSIEPNEVEAYAQTLGSVEPVDLFNGAVAPRRDVFSCDVLVRAQDATTDPAAAWAEVAAGVRALQGLPTTGVLVVNSSPGGGTVSCTARRKRIPIKLAPQNARHYVATLTFVCLTDWA